MKAVGHYDKVKDDTSESSLHQGQSKICAIPSDLMSQQKLTAPKWLACEQKSYWFQILLPEILTSPHLKLSTSRRVIDIVVQTPAYRVVPLGL